MARITVEDCLDKVHNRFSLVVLVAKRAKQLVKGAKPTVNIRKNKPIVGALREVAGGHVYYDTATTGENPDLQIERDINR